MKTSTNHKEIVLMFKNNERLSKTKCYHSNRL